MNILAIESADGACSVAMWRDGRMDCRRNDSSRDSLSWLMQQCQDLQQGHGQDAQALDGLACCVGPGGFTGVRVAVGYSQGLGIALGLPVLGVSSLDALAEQVTDADEFWVALDARMGELYAACYQRDGKDMALRRGEELLITPEKLSDRLAPGTPCYGPGFRAFPDRFPQARKLDLDAAAVARRASRLPLSQWPAATELAPTYLRNKVAQTLAERQAARGSR